MKRVWFIPYIRIAISVTARGKPDSPANACVHLIIWSELEEKSF